VGVLHRLFKDRGIRYKVFIYTGPLANTPGCDEVLHILRSQLGAELREATPQDVADEEEFEAVTGAGHMRQWFKLQRAYDLMEAHERRTGRAFDLVLKLRTDLELPGPLSLADFPEVLVARVVYTVLDLLFLCSREAARTLLGDIQHRLEGRAGNERRILPIKYDKLLRGDGRDVAMQVFPDLGSERFREAVQQNHINVVKMEVRRHRAALEALHRRADAGEVLPIVSGHWRFRNDTQEYKKWEELGRLPKDDEMDSIRHWYYHLHTATPEVSARGWPVKVPLSRMRHYRQCNCEPPDCFRADLPYPWPPLERLRRLRGRWQTLLEERFKGDP